MIASVWVPCDHLHFLFVIQFAKDLHPASAPPSLQCTKLSVLKRFDSITHVALCTVICNNIKFFYCLQSMHDSNPKEKKRKRSKGSIKATKRKQKPNAIDTLAKVLFEVVVQGTLADGDVCTFTIVLLLPTYLPTQLYYYYLSQLRLMFSFC